MGGTCTAQGERRKAYIISIAETLGKGFIRRQKR
jgi:hypothetical protein